MSTNNNNHYPDFEYTAAELSAYAHSVGTFVISLKTGKTVHFTPTDADDFKQWLDAHKIRDIRVNDGIRKVTRNDLSTIKTRRK